MRDQLKVIIGFGSIWGVFVLGGILLSSFTMGANDTAPETLALFLYAFTTLPSCILAIWHRRACGCWLIGLSVVTLYGFAYQIVVKADQNASYGMSLGAFAWMSFFIMAPALIGVALLRTPPLNTLEGELG